MKHFGPFLRATTALPLDSKFWNISFTSMLRQTQARMWGNWPLHSSVQPGMMGILNPETGDFRPATVVPNAKIVKFDQAQDWSMESSSVRRKDTNVDFAGGYTDPSTGTTVNVGLKTSWTFEREGSIISKATVAGESVIDDPGALLAAEFPAIYQAAQNLNMTTPEGIVQGFGVITRVVRAKGVINLGARTDASTFSITGSVDGVNAMSGSGDPIASVKGSYKDVSQTGSFEEHLFPAEANKKPDGEAILMYEFASFDGKTILPGWTGPISPLNLTFDNGHGGTYIVHCKVLFDTPDKRDHERKISVPGGQSHSISGIPLSATNLRVQMDFVAGDSLFLQESKPVATWEQGRRTIDLYGVWPWSCNAAWRLN